MTSGKMTDDLKADINDGWVLTSQVMNCSLQALRVTSRKPVTKNRSLCIISTAILINAVECRRKLISLSYTIESATNVLKCIETAP